MAKKKHANFKSTHQKAASKKQPSQNAIPQNSSTHHKDINSKTVFHNHVLCSQFLRDNINIPLFKNIQPEDIEDHTDRFIPYFGVEFEADTVKKVRIKNEGENFTIYLISLIEHKSDVDYNVSIQLLKYMACIWAEYEKQFGTDYKNQVKTKSFRYPPILPIVYYEGTGTWTAAMHLKERIYLHDIFAEYIPDFTYCLVNIHDFSTKELLDRGNEMSLIMLLNRVQNAAGLSEFLTLPVTELNSILEHSPEAVVDVIVMFIQALCTRFNLSKEATEKCVEKVRANGMGYFFENFEKIDIEVERRNTAREHAKFLKVQSDLQDMNLKLQNATVELQNTTEELQHTTEELHNTTEELHNTTEELHNTQTKLAYLESLLKAHGISVD